MQTLISLLLFWEKWSNN